MLTHEFWYMRLGEGGGRGKEKKSSYNMSDVEGGGREESNKSNQYFVKIIKYLYKYNDCQTTNNMD